MRRQSPAAQSHDADERDAEDGQERELPPVARGSMTGEPDREQRPGDHGDGDPHGATDSTYIRVSATLTLIGPIHAASGVMRWMSPSATTRRRAPILHGVTSMHSAVTRTGSVKASFAFPAVTAMAQATLSMPKQESPGPCRTIPARAPRSTLFVSVGEHRSADVDQAEQGEQEERQDQGDLHQPLSALVSVTIARPIRRASLGCRWGNPRFAT
jgi:hypothetical protein